MMHARFSPCGRFRLLLWERWAASRPMLVWCLFNPSVAGQDGRTDPTWRKGRGFSERLGYGGQVFCNLFDFVATKPANLRAAGYPCSSGNDWAILEAAGMGDGTVVCAWGALARGLDRPREVVSLLAAAGARPVCLGTTDDGLPRHPLMLPYSAVKDIMPYTLP